MSQSPGVSMDISLQRNVSVLPLVIPSILFHLFVLLGIPLLTKLIFQPKKYSRPQTFRLVTMPPPKPKTQKSVVKEKTTPKKKKKHVPRDPSAARPKEVEPEENLDELESLLEELPVPTRISAPGDFKYDWYILNVEQKIQRHWKPPNPDRNLSVLVAFSIFPNGAISGVKVKRSSGNGSLDNMAIRAVNLAAPFGKLPIKYQGNQLDISLTLIPIAR